MKKFTILFITKNRRDILNSLNSCLKIKKYHSNLHIIILDGNKNNYLNNKIKSFKKLVNLKIIKQKKSGFMNACFQAVEYLDEGYFTFMYDDDILSPYFGKLVSYSCKRGKQIYGYGIIYPKNNIFKFNKPKLNFISKNKIDFLKEYFSLKSKKVLPNSPITSIFSVKIIKKWKNILTRKINDEISECLMIKKNIGPDLLLYLISLELDKKNIKTIVSNDITAKFSSHKNSMSIQYGSNNLRFGYWIAKTKFLNHLENKQLIGRKLIFIHFIKGFFILLLYLIDKKKFKNFNLKNYISIYYDIYLKIFF